MQLDKGVEQSQIISVAKQNIRYGRQELSFLPEDMGEDDLRNAAALEAKINDLEESIGDH